VPEKCARLRQQVSAVSLTMRNRHLSSVCIHGWLLDLALTLEPVVEDIEINRGNAEELAAGSTVFPSPDNLGIYSDCPFGVR
jgi:hypothetical protein